VDLAQIEAFLVLAEELHFGKAAQRLHVSQPMVSRRVAALEREVGAALFERTSRRVVLTPLGVRLHDNLRPVHEQLFAAVGDARRAARSATGPLRVGFTTITAAGESLTTLVRAFEHAHPDVEVTLHEVRSDRPLDALRDGEVDILVNWLISGAPDLTNGPVLSEHDMILIVADKHPLAGRASVTFEELADYELANMPSLSRQESRPFLPDRTPSGRLIRTRPMSTWQEALIDVALGTAVQVTVDFMACRLARSDVVVIPITDLPPTRLGLIWRTAHSNARIGALAQVAQSIAPLCERSRRRNDGSCADSGQCSTSPRPRATVA
jgi:DNA-binding transcriptional LysR family regulator